MLYSNLAGDFVDNTIAGGLSFVGTTTFFTPPASFGYSFTLATSSHTVFGFAGAVGIAGAIGYGAGLAFGACIFENDSNEQKNLARIWGAVAAGGVAASFLGTPLPIVASVAATAFVASAVIIAANKNK